jgi:hypothetical protein
MGGRIPPIFPVALAAALFRSSTTLAFQLPLAGMYSPRLAARRPHMDLQRRTMVAGTTVLEAEDPAEKDVGLKPAGGGKPVTFRHRLCVAPMIGVSDLAFRVATRRWGADCAWTEMFYSDRIVSDPGYMERVLESSPEDRPLVVQVPKTPTLILRGRQTPNPAPSCHCVRARSETGGV